jgi:hypothetical protein
MFCALADICPTKPPTPGAPLAPSLPHALPVVVLQSSALCASSVPASAAVASRAPAFVMATAMASPTASRSVLSTGIWSTPVATKQSLDTLRKGDCDFESVWVVVPVAQVVLSYVCNVDKVFAVMAP